MRNQVRDFTKNKAGAGERGEKTAVCTTVSKKGFVIKNRLGSNQAAVPQGIP